jgi:hypothetical protein
MVKKHWLTGNIQAVLAKGLQIQGVRQASDQI